MSETIIKELAKSRILIVDDDRTACDMLREALEGADYDIQLALSGEEAVELGRAAPFDVVITDLKMKELDGIEVVRAFQKHSPEAAVIVITAFGSIDSAVAAIEVGAYDYLSKPFNLNEIRMTIRRALDRHPTKSAACAAPESMPRPGMDEIIGQSPKMVEVYRIVARVAKGSSTVLIQGESGTGKELIARAIHTKSARNDKPFMVVNCGAISEHLFESELFGHERGAFTGAAGLHRGILEEANTGTCLLDEIGEMPLYMQTKLLRFLQDGEIKRVGSAHSLKLDVRVLAATNRNLEQMAQQGTFRGDLLYRLSPIVIQIPPLRERREDLAQLIDYFLKKYATALTRSPMQMAAEAMDILTKYHWGGNVRELENVVERAVTLSPSSIIRPETLPTRLQFPDRSETEKDPAYPVTLSLREMERRYMLQVLESVGGNISRAAAILGIDRKTLRVKLGTRN
ncbi:MAG: sigma-54-dependent Fis family transcriptional regulator [Acidobacteria bacterium]|nr:sigma-54-dependent Fis family transcriptional regulator [Acidobacteriota bacterium]MBI3654936.1 sigma-54-dependent Fis family transcriptional regulator [Acidobacteriota bacterium]